jgi:class 3 adenylate cyclase
MDASLPRGTVTFLFTDIEGSTDLVRRLGDRYGDVRAEHGRLFEEVFPAHGGRVIDTQGDAYFAVFDRAGDAVAAAVAAQRALAARQWPEATQLRVRMGLHTAEPYLHESGYVGIGVHRAARICAAAHGGQILLSQATAGIVEDEELQDVELRDLGEHRLKDMSRPQRLVELTVAGLQTEFAPPQTLDRADASAPYGRVGTLLATDIIGFGKMIRTLGDEATASITRSYREAVRDSIAEHGGETLEAVGDTVIGLFERAGDAIASAASARAALQRRDWRPDVQLHFCAAVHTGRVVAKDYVGHSAWHCLQLCSSAESGQILVSHSAEAMLQGELLGDLRLRDLGERQLPTLETPRHVFEVVAGAD